MTQKSRNKSGFNNLHYSLAEPNAQKRDIEDCRSMRLGGSNGIVPTVIDAAKITNYVSNARAESAIRI